MPLARGNQPFSTGSNYNQRRYNRKPTLPKKPKYLKPKKPKPAKASTDNKQTMMINKLSKDLYALKMQSYGKVQQNYQNLERVLSPTATTPLCLDLNDLTCVSGLNVPSPPNGACVFQHVGGTPFLVRSHWLRPQAASNVYWGSQNLDQPDTGSYLHMNSTYFIDVVGNPNLSNIRVRFDVVAQKQDAMLAINQPGGGTDPAVLPWTLGSMKHLAEPHVNRINPIYFKKYFSRTVYLNSQPANTSGVHPTTSNSQRFSFTVRPNKVITQSQTNPIIDGVPIIDEATGDPGIQEEIEYGNFGPKNVTATQPLWLVISSDDSDDLNKVDIKIGRRCVWRDSVGSANL